MSFEECEICASEGYPGNVGDSTISCFADRILNPEIYGSVDAAALRQQRGEKGL